MLIDPRTALECMLREEIINRGVPRNVGIRIGDEEKEIDTGQFLEMCNRAEKGRVLQNVVNKAIQ